MTTTPLSSIGWARKNWSSIFIEHDIYSEKILSAIGTAQRSGIPLTIFNYPLCHLPERAWGFATQSISDWKNYYPKECDECTLFILGEERITLCQLGTQRVTCHHPIAHPDECVEWFFR
jgi:hypothetical protein